MAVNVLAVVTLHRVTGVARDNVQNTFAWKATPPHPAVVAADVFGYVEAFYTAAPPSGPGIGQLINDTVSRPLFPTVDLYDLDPVLAGGNMGAPFASDVFSLPNAIDGSMLPDEVSVVNSVHSELTGTDEFGPGTRPRARHRGRQYIGPLVAGAPVVDTSTGIARPAGNIINALVDASTRMSGNSADDGVENWCVWSRKNNALTPIIGGFVDNAFDTQRRRGTDPTHKTIWGAF